MVTLMVVTPNTLALDTPFLCVLVKWMEFCRINI